jgi:FixJ family two-component response regulator
MDLQRLVSAERSEMPIIFVMGVRRCADDRQGDGAVEFLTKPFRDDALLNAIEQALERSRIALARELEVGRCENATDP